MILEEVQPGSENIVFVYTTCSSKEEAKSIGLSVINEHLAISADYWFVDSIYPWNGVVEEVEQYMLMLSTQKKFSEQLIEHIESMHSYHVPMIARSDISMTNHLYKTWVENTLGSKEKLISEADEKIIKEREEFHYSRLK